MLSSIFYLFRACVLLWQNAGYYINVNKRLRIFLPLIPLLVSPIGSIHISIRYQQINFCLASANDGGLLIFCHFFHCRFKSDNGYTYSISFSVSAQTKLP